jgi:hypothetical protein
VGKPSGEPATIPIQQTGEPTESVILRQARLFFRDRVRLGARKRDFCRPEILVWLKLVRMPLLTR